MLIRVRALGSYYDALTHVRRNGFWEQVRTFELIPRNPAGHSGAEDRLVQRGRGLAAGYEPDLHPGRAGSGGIRLCE